jgi:osmotically-inducible protein OsmY
VRLLTPERRDDAEVRGTVLRTLSWNAAVPDTIDATVENGVVRLTGTAEFRHQRDDAEAAIRNLRGVVGIDNQIKVKSPFLSAGVADQIEKTFERSAQIDAGEVEVESLDDGTVTLSGTVRTSAEHDAALAAARAAHGVEHVVDRLVIGIEACRGLHASRSRSEAPRMRNDRVRAIIAV